MHLTARVISDSGQTLTEPAKTFGEDGGTIGRSPEADWTLPDPSRFLSRIHARIFYSAGAFYIEDIRTNGIYHIYAAEKSPINCPAQLHHGNRLKFGDYEVSIEISGTPDFVFKNTDWGLLYPET
jgi:predicted component of type VI protein secretion system